MNSENKSLSLFFVKNIETHFTSSELSFASFLLKHNIPLAVSDHARNLFRAMFPDSKITEKYWIDMEVLVQQWKPPH